MTVEITSIAINKGIVTITVTDISEENLQRIERYRTDNIEHREIEVVYDTKVSKDFHSLRNFLKSHKATKGCNTWGEALHATLGTIVSMNYGKLA